MRSILLVIVLASAAFPVHADRCWMTGGCVGEIGFMHIPAAQAKSADVFVEPGLPLVNSTIQLKRNGFYFQSRYISDERLPADLQKAIKEGTQLAWGGELAKGATLRVLGYQTFPQLKAGLGNEIFALVLVITDQ